VISGRLRSNVYLPALDRRNADLGVVYYHLKHVYDLDATSVLLWTSGENAECLIYLNYAFILVRLCRISCFDLRAKTITVIELSCPAEPNMGVKGAKIRGPDVLAKGVASGIRGQVSCLHKGSLSAASNPP
jgi:hypothetical protein